MTNRSSSAPSEGIRASSWFRHRGAQFLLDFVLPQVCLACGERIEGDRTGRERTSGESGDLGLCRRCALLLEPAPRPACLGCGRVVDAGSPLGLCLPCRPSPPTFDEILAGWTYEPPLDRVILGLKHRRLDYLGEALGHRLAERFVGSLQGIDLVVPVPTAWWRRLRRGYNQAERIARPVAGHLGLSVSSILRRSAFRRPQKGLGRQARLENLRNAFRCPPRLSAERVLLVDDVATTGATLEAASQALKAAGAGQVIALVAGRRGPSDPSLQE